MFGFLGRRFHNGKLITIGALSQAVGSLVMVSVHFISQPYELGPLQADTCSVNGKNILCFNPFLLGFNAKK